MFCVYLLVSCNILNTGVSWLKASAGFSATIGTRALSEILDDSVYVYCNKVDLVNGKLFFGEQKLQSLVVKA